MSFPADFRWGVSTAAHQIEGNNTNSDFWFMENLTPTCFIDSVHAATGKPIVVSENGLETANDEARVWYLESALPALAGAMDAGVPVQGYFHWSLLDNFEWERGYSSHFGLHTVDPTTFVRTPKPSATRYTELVRAARG